MSREFPPRIAAVRRAAVLAAAVLGASPLVAAAAPSQDRTPARTSAAASGVVFGGMTGDGFAVMVETTKSRRQIVRMAIGLTLRCTSGISFGVPDRWRSLPVKRGRFSGAFGPTTERNDDGTTTDFEGSVSGRFNQSRTSISGTWMFTVTQHDAAGAVVDTCDSGEVDWTAKQ